MRWIGLSACLVACGGGDPIPSQVSGTLDGIQLVLGGGGWAWTESRVAAGNGQEFKPYTLYVEMTGASFEVIEPLEDLELEERHRIAAAVALADRLSFALPLVAMGDEVESGGRYETSDGDAVIELAIGSRRDDGVAATEDRVAPRSIGKDRGWALSVENVTLPADGQPGRFKASLQLSISRQTTDPSDSLTGDLNVAIDLPLVGSWLGQCQKMLLLEPEGQSCPR